MLTVLAVAAALLCQAPSAPAHAAAPVAAQDRAADEAAIRAGAAEWAEAFTRGDVAAVDRLIADDFLGTAKNGTRYDKQTMLGWVRAGPNMTASATTVETIRFHGDIAIATGTDAMVGPAPELRRIKTIWTDIWIRRNGRWQVLAAHDMAGTPD